MIDLHCHVLPELDDGALDMDDSVGMGRQADRDGVTLICATPHIRHDHDVRLREIPERVDAVNAALAAAGVAVRVAPGAEVAETALDGLDDGDLSAASLGGGGGGWILLEPAPGPLGPSLVEAVRRLRARGRHVLVAHPERHLGPELANSIAALVAQGALVQATAAAVTDDASREGMLALARRGLVHVLGSDAHSSRGGRPVALAAALDVLAAVPELAGHREWIAEVAPRAIVAGETLTPPFTAR
jgi:protein-tyrosine phosphatase